MPTAGCSRLLAALVVVLVAGSALAIVGGEVTVQNDRFISGGPAVVVGDFISGEEAAVRLTSPCDGSIVAIQIGWLSGAGQSIERAIHIYDGSTFPSPGPELETLDAPLLTPGALNEFRFLDEQMSIPLIIPVTSGQEFIVSLEFENPTNVNGGSSSVFHDVNGCQFGRNALFAIPGGWLDFCIFLTGDLVIRAVVDCGAVACPWDCGNDDGVVNTIDFLALLAQWGTVNPCDFDGGGVGVTDFLDLLANWGDCP